MTNDQQDISRILRGIHADPFAYLGCHEDGDDLVIRAYTPHAQTVAIAKPRGKKAVTNCARLHEGGIFEARIKASKLSGGYRFIASYDGVEHHYEDPYRFAPDLGDLDLHLLSEGRHVHAFKALGAHVKKQEGSSGTRFTVWAPNAAGVCVAGDFNMWNTTKHPMRSRGASGIWEIFIPGVEDGAAYKYVIRDARGHMQPLKADPVGFGAEMRPKSASVVRDLSTYKWKDARWMKSRAARHHREAPMSVYEVHLGSWQRGDTNQYLSYAQLAKTLIPYVKDLGFTHIELLPITEHPFDGSWGYQPVGLYAPTIRFGPPHEFRDFVEAAHEAEIGVLLDWVPGHFPSDAHGLVQFDGTALYEHADPREGFHQDWNTLIYNYGRIEVKNYLVSNALYWLEEYHLDGLRVDAVASMLYRDYSREDGQWVPNKDGGRENYEAIGFLQEMNVATYGADPSIMTVAEESTSFPAVSQPVHTGGLGFGYKWNMGWMNDTLRYMEKDPIYRQHDHHLMTFPIDWAFTENFILPISHDEVVHGKGSMIAKMPGNDWEKFANLRAYYAFMWMHPGKKLLFMGCEFAQPEEWNHNAELNWGAAEQPDNKGVQQLIRDLNALYRTTPALHLKDCEAEGFSWLCNSPEQSTMGFVRHGSAKDAPVVTLCNFTPVERVDFRAGVPKSGYWEEVLNTDAAIYGGGNRGNLGGADTVDQPADGHAQSVTLTLPPLSVIVLRLSQ